MRETYPTKEAAPGAPTTSRYTLGADHINNLSAAARKLSAAGGSYSPGIRGSFHANVGLAPFLMKEVEVVDLTIDDNDTADSGLYLVVFVYWSPPANPAEGYGSWPSEDPTNDGTWVLDAREFGGGLSVGDRLIAWWDEQRGAFIPTGRRPSQRTMVELSRYGYADPASNPALTEHASQEGTSAFFHLELSFDGGATWQIAQNRQFAVTPDLEDGALSSACGFVAFGATDGTLVRLRAFAASKTRATLRLAKAALRLETVSQGGSGSFHGASNEAWDVVDQMEPKIEVNNDLDNPTARGIPTFVRFSDSVVVVRTPRVDPDSPGSGYQWWTVAAHFSLGITATVKPCHALIDVQAYGGSTLLPAGGAESGTHVTFQLEINNKIIQNRQFHIPLVEDARASGTGVVTFKAVTGDVVTLTAYLGDDSLLDARLIGGFIRLEAKCDQAIANSNGSGGGYTKVTGLGAVAAVNTGLDSFIRWPLFLVGSDRVTIAVPANWPSWTIAAEFGVTVSAANESSQSSSSSSSQSMSTSSSSQSVSTSSSSQSMSTSSSSSESGACPTIEANLTGTISNKTGDCACMPATITYAWLGGNNYSTSIGCAGDPPIPEVLSCSGGTWDHTKNGGYWDSITIVSQQNSPLEIVVDVVTSIGKTGCGGGGGSFRITITE